MPGSQLSKSIVTRVRVSKATCVNFDVRAGYRVSDGVSGLVEGLVGASHGSRNPGPEG